VWKDPVHLHLGALHQAVAGHTAVAENQEVLILRDLHPEEVVLHQVVAVPHPVVAAADHHLAGVSLNNKIVL
jgi:enoyl-CoA hydratase/carnithine racemase